MTAHVAEKAYGPPVSRPDARLKALREAAGLSGRQGTAARAVFYFVLRYADTISHGELPPDHLDILIDWHEREAVSEWERHRNAAIFARQGNRNPFIDHPQSAAQVRRFH